MVQGSGGRKVIYLYNIEGWAIHDVGRSMQADMAPMGVEVECRSTYDWHARPEAADVVHIGYSGLFRPWFDYRRWAERLVVTVHDPCEISHFEDRLSWKEWPLRPMSFDAFDDVGVISAELADVFATRFGRPAIRTPTWPSRAAAIRARGRDRVPGEQVRLFASTNADSHFPFTRMVGRLRRPSEYLLDERRRFSPRQLAALFVRRRRKNVPLLRHVAAVASRAPGGSASLTVGTASLRSREDYEASLHGCTVYACTSTMEGGPLTVMEAVLAGAAILTTPVGQVTEWVEDGGNGWICRDAADFERALTDYARHPAILIAHQRASMEIAAARHAPDPGNWYRFLTGSAPSSER